MNMRQQTPVTPFGNDATFAELAEKIRGFSYDDASPTEQVELAGALKLLAQETVSRWETVRRMEDDLRSKLSMAKVREAMNDVIVVTREGNQRGVFARLADAIRSV